MTICNICFDELNISERGLVNTGLCMHKYCLVCYTNYCISRYNQNKSVNCPVCKIDLVNRNLYIKPENVDVEFEDVHEEEIIDRNGEREERDEERDEEEDREEREEREEEELIDQLVKIQIASNLMEIKEIDELKKVINESIKDLDKINNIQENNNIVDDDEKVEQYYDVLNGNYDYEKNEDFADVNLEEQKRLEEMYELRQQELLFAKFKISN